MRVSRRGFRQLAIVTLVMLMIVVVAGAVVRLTDSGLGCADWPQCSESRFIDVTSRHAAIEQFNRIYSALVGVAAVALWVASILLRPRDRAIRLWATAVAVGVGANGVIGGISVRVDLHPLGVQSHLLLALFCVVGATVLVRLADGSTADIVGHSGTDGVAVSPGARVAVLVLCASTAAAMVSGTIVTGAGPHAGDESAERIDIAIESVARIHSVLVVVALMTALWLAYRCHASAVDRSALSAAVSTWIFVGLLQAALGWVQYFSDVPTTLVGLHVLGATAITWATTQVALAMVKHTSPGHRQNDF